MSSLLNKDDAPRLDTPFPRGGGSAVTPLEIKKANVEATRDVFDEVSKGHSSTKSTGKRKRHQKSAPKAVENHQKLRIESLVLNKLKVGTLVLGQIDKVLPSKDKLVLSLPNNLIGYVDLSDDDADDEIETEEVKSSLPYKEGQWLRCIVTGVGEAPHKHLQLSIDPALVNQTIADSDWVAGMSVQGTIKSIEDRGCVLDFGNSTPGFLSGPTDGLSKGQTVLGYISHVKSRATIVTLDPQAKHLDHSVESQASLVPGCLVQARVTDVSSSGGLYVELFEHIPATIDYVHSHEKSDAPGKDSTLLARVLFSHPAVDIGQSDRPLGLSILKHTTDMPSEKLGNDLQIGQVIERARVSAVAPSLGLALDIGLDRAGFAHVSRLRHDRVEDDELDTKFKIGTIHRARVLGYSDVDNLYQLTLDPEVISQRYLSIHDVQVGDVIDDAKVERFVARGGVIVAIGQHINGLVSDFHISDLKIENPEKRLKIGQKVAARVLNVDIGLNRISLTLKKSLVNSDESILTSYEQLTGRTPGTIVSFKPRGATVEFFNGVRGFLPLSEMSEASIARPSDQFRLGQSVNVRVLEAIPDSRRLIVSCRAPRSSNLAIGDVIDGNKAVVTARSKSELRLGIEVDGEDEDVVLPVPQISDDPSEAKALAKSLKEGARLDRKLRVIGFNQVTAKKSLLEATLLNGIDDLVRGQSYNGYVSGTDPKVGLFVAFLSKSSPLVGLIPATELPESTDKWPTLGQSLKPFVTGVDTTKGRFFLTLKTNSSNIATKSASDLPRPAPGDRVTATITAVKQTQLNVTVNGHQGRVDVSQLFSSIADIKDPLHPLAQFKRGETLDNLLVIGFHDARNHRFLPLSHKGGSHVVLELSAISKSLSETPLALKEGDSCLAFINNANSTGEAMWANVTPTIRGKISRLDVGDELPPIGAALACKVIQTSPQLLLSHKDSGLALIHKVMPSYLNVRLSQFRSGRVVATDSSDDYKVLKDAFSVGSIIPARIVAEDGDTDQIFVSLRPSVVFPDAKHEVIDPVVAAPPAVGTVLRGFVKNAADAGLFVDLGRGILGRVQISQLSDAYIKDWKPLFKPGQIVRGKVIKLRDNRVELSLKESVVSGKSQGQTGLESLKVGQVFDGTVRRVTTFGVFVNLSGTQISGLCHKSQVADRDIDDLERIFTTGDHVKVKVLDVNTEKRQLSLGMKSSYFEDDDANMDSSDEEVEEMDVDAEESEDSSSENRSSEDDDNDEHLRLDSSSEEDSSDASMSDSDTNAEEPSTGLSAGFDWNGGVLNESGEASSSDSDSDDDSGPRKRRKKETFVEDKTASLAHQLPQSTKDFERLLVATPNSSMLWMNYMAFQLQLGEIDAARQLARRALTTIAMREQEEKFNVWIALLNLENSFGTPDSVKTVFREAVQRNDALTVYLRMAGIYEASGNNKEAAETFNQAARKFGSESLDVWTKYQKFLFDTNQLEKARSLSDRALRQLPKRLHRDFTLQFAKLEFGSGDPERARTLLEALVATYPKRLDLWSVYLDLEIKHARDRQKVTALFERVFNKVRLTLKQAKFLFKKWLQFETDSGDEKGQEYVKSKAAQYVAALAKKEAGSDSESGSDSE